MFRFVSRDGDPNCNQKKRHIGNDSVLIVYNESGKPYDKAVVKVRGAGCSKYRQVV
jgi:hypothetical protein